MLTAEPVEWNRGSGYDYIDLPKATVVGAGFTETKPAQTGIVFTNALPVSEMMANPNLMNGSGVAAGDFDGDGWCDLYLAAIHGTNALYRNLGNWRFEDVTAKYELGMPNARTTGATFADVDGDQDLDLIVGTLGGGPRLFLNENDAFPDSTRGAGIAAATGTTTLALADVDGDGDLDLYVTNYGELAILRSGGRADAKLVNGRVVLTGPYSYRLRFIDGRLEEVGEPDCLYLNDGKGRFKKLRWQSEFFRDEEGRPRAEPWDFGLAAVMRDLDNDADPDIYVCNDFQSVDRIWINDGKGFFHALPRLAMRKQSFSAMGVDFADLNSNGSFDFLVTEMMSSHHTQRMRNVSGLAPSWPQPGFFQNREEVVRNTLFLNRGDNTYAEIAEYAELAATDWSWQPLFLDVDLDGRQDVLVGNGFPFNIRDRDVVERINASMQARQSTPEQLRRNLLLYPRERTKNFAAKNMGDLKFADASDRWGFDSERISQGAALADFDNDGDLDVVMNCLNDGVLLYRNDAEACRIAVRLDPPPGTTAVGAVVRMRAPGFPLQMQEIICGGRYLSGDDTVRSFAAAENGNVIEVTYRNGRSSVFRNLPGNRVYRLQSGEEIQPPPTRRGSSPLFSEPSGGFDHIHVDRQFNDYQYQPLLWRQLSQTGPAVVAYDLDRDGHDELLIGSGAGGRIAGYRFTSAGTPSSLDASDLPVLNDDVLGMTGWSWSSGERAILMAKANYESGAAHSQLIELREISDGKLKFTAVFDFPGPEVIGTLAVADFDRDGDLDLFAGGSFVRGRYPESCDSYLFRQGGGRLVLDEGGSSLFKNVGLITGAVWADLESDGHPDLVLACDWGPLRVWDNINGELRETTAERGLEQMTGWWNAVCAGDFDADGKIDIVAVNWGENTGYRASSERPAVLHYGRADAGMMHLIEGYYPQDGETAYPVRPLSTLRQAFPALNQTFHTHAAFARAEMPAVLEAVGIPMQKKSAATLQSVLLLNRGGRFEVQPLPVEAQLAPSFAAVAADFNRDSHLDLFLSQNFFAVRPEWPRMDAGRGLILLGDGNGNFDPMSGDESGVKIYGEQRGAVTLDYNRDGSPDLVVSQNAAPTILLRGGSASAR